MGAFQLVSGPVTTGDPDLVLRRIGLILKMDQLRREFDRDWISARLRLRPGPGKVQAVTDEAVVTRRWVYLFCLN